MQQNSCVWASITSMRLVHSCFSSRATTSFSISALNSRPDSTQMGGASDKPPAVVKPPES